MSDAESVRLRLQKLKRALNLNSQIGAGILALAALWASVAVEPESAAEGWIAFGFVIALLCAATALLVARGRLQWQVDMIEREDAGPEASVVDLRSRSSEVWLEWPQNQRNLRGIAILGVIIAGVLLAIYGFVSIPAG